MGKVQNYINALKTYGDGRYHYYDGRAMGIGCSEYTRLALVAAGVIGNGQTFHAGSGNRGCLTDTSRFQCLAWNPAILQPGDILWSHGHHVATWAGNNSVYEAAPEATHPLATCGTGVGLHAGHGYWNCGTGTNTWSCIYRIIDGTNVEKTQTAIGKLDAFIGALPAIQNGAKGDIVKILQTELKRLGFYTGDIDGSAGPMTVNAIKAAQKAWGISVDGSFGPQSWKKLLK